MTSLNLGGVRHGRSTATWWVTSGVAALMLLTLGCSTESAGKGETPAKEAVEQQRNDSSKSPAGTMAGMNMGEKKDEAAPAGSSVTLTAAQIRHGGVTWQSVTIGTAAGTVAVPGQIVPNEDRTARHGA